MSDDEGETTHKRAMFGDAFGSRGDYSKGFFYGGRRKIIPDSNTPKGNYLQPPEMFMTRRQTKNHRAQANDGLKFKLEFADALIEKKEFAVKAKSNNRQENTGKKKKNGADSIIVLDKYSSTKKEDWITKHQAGCTFYVNNATGEATSEIPWELGNECKCLTDSLDAEQDKQFHVKSGKSSGLDDALFSDGDTIEEGTGAHVYDDTELKSFLSILDSISQQNTPQKRKI